MATATTSATQLIDSGPTESVRADLVAGTPPVEGDIGARKFFTQDTIRSTEDTSNSRNVLNDVAFRGVGSGIGAIPLPFRIFAGISLGGVALFGTLFVLALVSDVELLHPFVAALGLIGSLGWLWSAWYDVEKWSDSTKDA